MSKQKIIIVLTVLFIIVSGIYYSMSFGKSGEAVFIAAETGTEDTIKEIEDVTDKKENSQSNLEAEFISEKKLYVHICGQINYSGVYCLEEESRIVDVVEMAGGFTENAAKDYVNLAQKLTDGQKIYIPALDELEDSLPIMESTGNEKHGLESTKVNINTADKEVLMTLTGIGEAKAEAIIRYREENDGFHHIEEIKQIEGIKDGVFNKIKDEIEI